jgi:hypothetical protein
MKKGFYIKKGKKDQSLYLNICKDDFLLYIDSIVGSDGWVKFRIFERDVEDTRGFTHNMESVSNKFIKDSE